MSAPEALPPHSIEAEQQVLGAILVAVDGDQTDERLAVAHQAGGADLFFDPVHAEVFREVSRRAAAGMAADATALAVWAREQDFLTPLGGPKYLVTLALSAVATTAFPSYCQHLADLRARRDLIGVCDRTRAALSAPDGDVGLVVGEMEMALAGIGAGGARRRPQSALSAAHEAFREIMSEVEGDGAGRVGTGLMALDRLVPAMRPGQLVILGGRPSMGKTAVALSIALNVARAGHGVGFFSLEMGPSEITRRAFSEITSQAGRAVCYADMERGALNQTQMQHVADAAKTFSDLPIMFLSREFNDIGGLHSGAKAAQRALAGNMRLLVVDYLQLIRSTAKSRYEQMTEISIALKGLAGRLGVPVLALSQLSRQVEARDDKRPVLSDLRESGQIEQDADVVIFAYRDEYYLERRRPDGEDVEKMEAWQRMMDVAHNRLELIVAKQRQGRIGTAHLMCNPALNRVWDERDRV